MRWLGQPPLPQRARSISNASSTGRSRRKRRARSAAIRSSWNRQLRRRAMPARHRLVSIEHRAPPRRCGNSRPTQSFRGAHDHVPNRGRRRSRHWHAGSTPSGAFRCEANLGERCTPKARHDLHKTCSWLRIAQGAARLGSNPRAAPRRPGSDRSGPKSPKPPTLAKEMMRMTLKTHRSSTLAGVEIKLAFQMRLPSGRTSPACRSELTAPRSQGVPGSPSPGF
jgi:hypothetical protein